MTLPATFVPGFHNETAVKRMKYNLLGATGLSVSKLSIGTAAFCLQYGDYSVKECRETLHKAIKSGVNYIDTAPWYGHGVSEEVLGKCLAGIPRQAYYLATKVGRYEADPSLMFDFSAAKTKDSIEISLRKLGVDYVDLIQVHDIEFAKSLDIIINETLPVLEDTVRCGKAKFIGITGYPISTLADCISKSNTKIDTVLSYCRLSLIDNALKDYLPEFQSRNLGIINAAGHGMGLFTNKGPQPWHPAPQHIKDVCIEANEYCKERGVDLAKLAMHYCYKQTGPHTNLVGMNMVKLLDYNLDILYNGITDCEQQILEEVQATMFAKLERGDWEEEIKKIKDGLP